FSGGVGRLLSVYWTGERIASDFLTNVLAGPPAASLRCFDNGLWTRRISGNALLPNLEHSHWLCLLGRSSVRSSRPRWPGGVRQPSRTRVRLEVARQEGNRPGHDLRPAPGIADVAKHNLAASIAGVPTQGRRAEFEDAPLEHRRHGAAGQ